MSRRSEALRKQREDLYRDQLGYCATCGMPVAYHDCELAHKIPEAKWAIKKWGRGVIDHWMNKAITHRGECNDAQNIQNRPVECARLVEKIVEINLQKSEGV